ncbi:hypothetical protein HQ487_02250 [Candidatus Uhrbacteria bacterium]|nr:hypothetical protein [Candidatus Uhrbacteria bacterium]
MIYLNTIESDNSPVSTFFAEVFLSRGEKSIGIVIRNQENQAILADSFNKPTLRRMYSEISDWLEGITLDKPSKRRFLTELANNFEMLQSFRENGPDIANGWPGSWGDRRLPDPDELYSN